MKRSWIGLGLLIVLMILGLVTGSLMERIHRPVADALQQAAGLAQAGLWEQAGAEARAAEQEGAKWSSLRNCMADHTPVEDAEGLFAQLDVYCEEEDSHFVAVCRELARKVEAIGQAHGLNAWNIL